MKRLIAPLLLLALPAQAQDWIDYEQILADNADQVTRSANSAGAQVRKLTIDPQITITCIGPEGPAYCTGGDRSGLDPIGCTMRITSGLLAVMRQCEAFATASEQALVAETFERTGVYVAANAVPPQDWSDLRPKVEADADLQAQWQSCDEYMDPEGWGMAILRAVMQDEAQEEIAQGLLVPRLPVGEPC